MTIDKDNYREFLTKSGHVNTRKIKNMGFLDGVLPYYIAHVENLKIIPAKDNLKKQCRCSHTLNELYNKIIDYNNNKEINDLKRLKS